MVNQCFAIALVVYDSKEKVTGFIEKCMHSPNMCGEHTEPSFLHVRVGWSQFLLGLKASSKW